MLGHTCLGDNITVHHIGNICRVMILRSATALSSETTSSCSASQCLNSDSCYDFGDLERFLNKAETLAAFGIPQGRG